MGQVNSQIMNNQYQGQKMGPQHTNMLHPYSSVQNGNDLLRMKNESKKYMTNSLTHNKDASTLDHSGASPTRG